MDYTFKEMTQEQAEEIASKWRYEGEYSFYDISADEEDLVEFLNPETRDDSYYIVKQGDEELGFFSFAVVEYSVDIGLGMKPEMTGRGLGLDFLKAGLSYAVVKYNPLEITLSVATFNERAIKIYKKVGFEPVETFMQDTNGSRFEFLKMKYECNKR